MSAAGGKRTAEYQPVRLPRCVWVPGVQYGAETLAQGRAREACLREHDDLLGAIEARADLFRRTPLWEVDRLESAQELLRARHSAFQAAHAPLITRHALFCDRGSVAPSRGCGHAADSGAAGAKLAPETATQSVNLAGGVS